MKRRVISMLLCVSMLISLVACGNTTGDTANEATDSADTAQVTEAASEEKDLTSEVSNDITATLRVLNWGDVAEETIANEAIARFNEKYPNVTVEQTCVPVNEWTDYITKWSTMITSGSAPDVVCIGFECTQMALDNQLLLPLNDLIDSDADLTNTVSQYTDAILSGCSDGDTIYGLPGGTQTMVMYYNKKIFDEKGVAYPKDGWTWDDFYETAKALTDGDVYGYGLSSSYFQLTPWWVTNSAYPVSDDWSTPTVNSDGMVEAVTYLNKFVEEGLTPDPISSDVYTMFSQKQLAMVGAGRWCLNTWQDAGLTSDDFDCVQWPQNTQAGTVYGGSAWCIGSATEQAALSAELLKEFVSEETMTEVAAGGQQIPSLKSLATDSAIMGTVPDGIGELWNAVSTATVVPAPSFYGELNTTLLKALENVFSGAKTPEDALNEAQASLEQAVGK